MIYRRLLIQLSVLIAFGAVLAEFQNRSTVAVMNFDAIGIRPEEAKTISELIRHEFAKRGIYEVTERERIDKVLKEIEFQQLGITEIEKATKVGKLLNAEKIVDGSVNRLGSLYIIIARLINVRTAKIEIDRRVQFDGPIEGIIPAIEHLVDQLTEETSEIKFVDKNSLKPRFGTREPDISEMIEIPGGEFSIGLGGMNAKILMKDNPFFSLESFSSELPQKAVFINSFYIDLYEVSNADYRQFCDANSRPYPPDPGWGGAYANYFLSHPDCPVVNVSWYDALDYSTWTGKRLPTEAEWEKAAKGRTDFIWPWGNEWLAKHCNSSEPTDSFRHTSVCGAFAHDRSPSGIFDMAGNVSEWCSDNYYINYYENIPYKNPKGAESGRSKVVKGGNWESEKYGCRISKRDAYDPDGKSTKIGFRCVFEKRIIE